MAKNKHHVEDHWRNSRDYRYEYFKRNPGYFGFLYTCSQCWKPMVIKKHIQVDHVVPPSKFSNKKKDWLGNVKSDTSFLAESMNSNVNLVAICPKCNNKKKDKIGYWTVKGWFAKIVEVTLFTAQKIVFLLLVCAVMLLWQVVRLLCKLFLMPFKMKSPWYVKVDMACLYIGFVYYIFNNLSSGEGFGVDRMPDLSNYYQR